MRKYILTLLGFKKVNLIEIINFELSGFGLKMKNQNRYNQDCSIIKGITNKGNFHIWKIPNSIIQNHFKNLYH